MADAATGDRSRAWTRLENGASDGARAVPARSGFVWAGRDGIFEDARRLADAATGDRSRA